MKLLADFNADDMSNKLELYIKDRAKNWRGKYPITISPSTTIDYLMHEKAAEFANDNWNHWHKQQALIKCLKLLSKLGVIEFVSLTKTKLTHGFLHTSTSVPFKLVLDQLFLQKFGQFIEPSRYIKYGEWQSNQNS